MKIDALNNTALSTFVSALRGARALRRLAEKVTAIWAEQQKLAQLDQFGADVARHLRAGDIAPGAGPYGAVRLYVWLPEWSLLTGDVWFEASPWGDLSLRVGLSHTEGKTLCELGSVGPGLANDARQGVEDLARYVRALDLPEGEEVVCPGAAPGTGEVPTLFWRGGDVFMKVEGKEFPLTY